MIFSISCRCCYRYAVVVLLVANLLFHNNYEFSLVADAETTTTSVPTGAQNAQDENNSNSSSSAAPAATAPVVVRSIEDDFQYDENDRLVTNYLVFPIDRDDCASAREESGFGYEIAEVEGDALDRIFPDYLNFPDGPTTTRSDPRCLAACLQKGVHKDYVGYTMPYLHYQSSGPPKTMPEDKNEREEFKDWYHSECKKTEVCFINYVSRKKPLKLYWIPSKYANLPRDDNFEHKRFQADIAYGEQRTYCFFSFHGHVFEAYGMNEEDDNKVEFYERVSVDHISTRAFGTSPPSSRQRFDDNPERLERNVRNALVNEWSKHFEVKRTFSSLGFAKGRLPNDVYASMQSFYYNNRNDAVNEEWEGKGYFVNWWESDVKFMSIPWRLKVHWQKRLADLVSAWSGVEVEQTSMYGLRQYESGARLLSHVDRKPTHAVSLIVNVAQENLANPWPVEVFDHADRLHEIDMQPGDIVYYESAKNLHGRNRPLQCRDGGNCKFVNLFTHYRPVEDGDHWHSNLDDMPNRPTPLVHGKTMYDDDSSVCYLSKEGSDVDSGLIGVGTVDCGDSRLGPYISPSLYKVSSADQLFDWWKATEDPNFVGTGYAQRMHGVEVDDANDDNNDNGTPSLQNSDHSSSSSSSSESNNDEL